MNRMGRFLCRVRQARGLSVQQVAQRMGYARRRKGVRVVMTAEAGGEVSLGRLAVLAEVLGVDFVALLTLQGRDKGESVNLGVPAE